MKTVMLILIATIYSCNNTSQNNVNTDSKPAGNDTIKAQKDIINNTVINDSIIHISFPKDSTWVTVNAKMKGFNHLVTVYIPVKQGRHLTASISSDDSAANVRINQIITPGDKADGPFGRDFTFAIHQQGTYRLLIGENLMQGDEWKGEFKLTVKVE